MTASPRGDCSSRADSCQTKSASRSLASRAHERTFAGRSFHTLRLTEGGFAIRYKKVELVNNNEVLDNLTFLI